MFLMDPAETRTVHVQYFTILREERGCREESVATNASTAAEFFDELQKRHGFSLGRDRFKVVVNEEFVGWSHPIAEGDSVVFVPPVAGG